MQPLSIDTAFKAHGADHVHQRKIIVSREHELSRLLRQRVLARIPAWHVDQEQTLGCIAFHITITFRQDKLLHGQGQAQAETLRRIVGGKDFPTLGKMCQRLDDSGLVRIALPLDQMQRRLRAIRHFQWQAGLHFARADGFQCLWHHIPQQFIDQPCFSGGKLPHDACRQTAIADAMPARHLRGKRRHGFMQRARLCF